MLKAASRPGNRGGVTVAAGAPAPALPTRGSIWPGGAGQGLSPPAPARTLEGRKGRANRVRGDSQAFLPKAGRPPAFSHR